MKYIVIDFYPNYESLHFVVAYILKMSYNVLTFLRVLLNLHRLKWKNFIFAIYKVLRFLVSVIIVDIKILCFEVP